MTPNHKFGHYLEIADSYQDVTVLVKVVQCKFCYVWGFWAKHLDMSNIIVFRDQGISTNQICTDVMLDNII